MISQEKKFHEESEHTLRENKDDYFTTNQIKKKELEMAKERGDKIAQLKHKRETLEYERQRILGDLDKVKRGDLQSLGGDRRGAPSALRHAGSGIFGSSTPDLAREHVDNALKDKLIADQVRINYLREQKQKTIDEMMNVDAIDELQSQHDERARSARVAGRMAAYNLEDPYAPPSAQKRPFN